MYNAILKYGWDNIKHEVLFDNLTQDEAENKEKELIKLYKSNIKKYGYNILKGGSLDKGLPKKIIKEISNKLKGRTPWNKGIPMTPEQKEKWMKKAKDKFKRKNKYIVTEETRKKLIDSHKGKVSSFKGKRHTEKAKEKMSESHKGKIVNNKPIRCINTNKEYISISQASKELEISITCISRVLLGYRKHTRGLIFEYIKAGGDI